MGKGFYFKLPHVPQEAEDVFDLLVGRETPLKYLRPAVRALLGFNVRARVFDKLRAHRYQAVPTLLGGNSPWVSQLL